MQQTTVVLTFVVAAALTATAQRRSATAPFSDQYPPVARSESEKRILQTLDEMVKAGELYANVPAADGRLLRLLTEATNAKSVVEIGTSTGISGLWFCLGLERTGGKLTTFELDPKRAATARANFRKAGVEGLVTIVQGNAHETLARLKDPVDIVFIDAEKDGYVDYFRKLAPIVRPGGLILAHNVDMVQDYIRMISADPNFDTVFYMQGGGLAASLKKR